MALAWPADLSQGRGVPDATKRPGAVGPDGNPLPAVWDTWKAVSEVFHYDDPSWTLTDGGLEQAAAAAARAVPPPRRAPRCCG